MGKTFITFGRLVELLQGLRVPGETEMSQGWNAALEAAISVAQLEYLAPSKEFGCGGERK